MKKIFLTFFALSFMSVNAAEKLHVSAMDEFSTLNPTADFRVKLLEDGKLNNIYMVKGDIIYCSLEKLTDPKRGKRDAKIHFNILAYEDIKGKHAITPELVGKYAKRVLNKEEIKKIPPKNVAKKVIGTAGDFVVTGFSKGVSFVDGAIENKEGNRFKSGAKQVYKDSLLSYVEYGEEINIQKDDAFYLVVKEKKQDKFKERKMEKSEIEEVKRIEKITNEIEEEQKQIEEIKEEVKEIKNIEVKVPDMRVEDGIEIILSPELKEKIEELEKNNQ